MQQCIREALVTQPSLRAFDGTAEARRRSPTVRPRGQIETEVGLLDLATHHLAWRRNATLCGGRVARCRNFSLQFDLTMTAVDILGITAEI